MAQTIQYPGNETQTPNATTNATSRLRMVTGSCWPRKCACGRVTPRDPEIRYVVDFGGPRPHPAYVREHSPDYGSYPDSRSRRDDVGPIPGYGPSGPARHLTLERFVRTGAWREAQRRVHRRLADGRFRSNSRQDLVRRPSNRRSTWACKASAGLPPEAAFGIPTPAGIEGRFPAGIRCDRGPLPLRNSRRTVTREDTSSAQDVRGSEGLPFQPKSLCRSRGSPLGVAPGVRAPGCRIEASDRDPSPAVQRNGAARPDTARLG